MITLSMIVKDEAAILANCLKSVKDFVDEIIIVDTGSTDDSIGIAKSFGANTQSFAWCDDFSAARNYALSFVKTPWTLFLDADDIVLNPELIPQIAQEAHKQRANAVWSIYKQDDSSYQRRLQLFKTKDYKWEGVVHESPQPKRPDNAASILSDLVVLHRKPIERCPEAARKYLDILLAKDPDNWLGLAESYKFLAIHPDDPDKEREYLEQAVDNYFKAYEWEGTNDPTKYLCLFHMAQLTLEIEAQDAIFPNLSRKFAQLGVSSEPERAECWVILGQTNQARGDLVKAAKCYEQALSLPPPTDTTGLVFRKYYQDIPSKLLKAVQAQIEDKRIEDIGKSIIKQAGSTEIWTP